MTKLQKRVKSEAFGLPTALQAGVAPTSPPMLSNLLPSHQYDGAKPTSSNPLSPFKNTHRRAVSTPKTPQTQWPLIATSTPPSVAYPTTPYHDTRTCGANCTRCGKRKLIQLNSPPSANIPTSAAPLRPIPQAHMRAVSEGTVSKDPKRLSISTTPAILTPGKPPCCHKCGRHKRPASLPVQSSSKAVQFQTPSAQRSQPFHPMDYSTVRSRVSGTTSGTPHLKRLPSRSPSPPSPDHFYSTTSTGNGEHIISPLSPRRKVDFAFPSKSSSGASNIPYSPLSPLDETVEIGTGRLINLISNAIRESSPPQSARVTPPLPATNSSQAHAYTPLLNQSHSNSRKTSLEILINPHQSQSQSTTKPPNPSTSTTHLINSRSPISLSTSTSATPLPPIELDSIPIGSTTFDILSSYSSDSDSDSSSDFEDDDNDTTAITLKSPQHHQTSDSSSYAAEEYTHDWTDALSMTMPTIIRLPSVKEGISRFKSLRGNVNVSGGSVNGSGSRYGNGNVNVNGSEKGNGNGNGMYYSRKPSNSVRGRFGSLRRDDGNNSSNGYYKQAPAAAANGGGGGGGGGGSWYGYGGAVGSNSNSKYQALGSTVEVGVY